MAKPFTIHEHDTGELRVYLYGKPIGIGLSLKHEIEAETICAALNRAFQIEFGRGYDAGQSDASRAKYLNGG